MTYRDDVEWTLRQRAVERAGREELRRRREPEGVDVQRLHRAAWLLEVRRFRDARALLREIILDPR